MNMNSSFRNGTNHTMKLVGRIGRRKSLMVLILCCMIQLVGTTAYSQIAGQTQKGQSVKVAGTVTDQKNGEPIFGATITVIGETAAASTDVNGRFSINARSNAELKISYVGYLPQLVNVNNQSQLVILLEENTKALEEVVVVGFGTQKKENLTGAVSTVTAKALESRPVTNVSQALQGLSPGLNITQNSGNLEGRPSINVRGLTTIGEGSSGDPLILIDGMEADINSLNPNDVENISVLKDAAASSIYGSRAPFGVILITTKQGVSGKTKVNVSSNYRINAPILLPDQMDSYTYVNYINIANRNAGNGDFFGVEQVQRVLDYQNGVIDYSIIPDPNNKNYWGDGYSFGNANVDWYRAVYKTSTPSQQHSVSLSGGTDKLNYYLSGDFLNQQGLMKLNQDTYNRYSINAKINAKLSEWATLSYTGRFTREDYNRPAALAGGLFAHLGRQGWPTLPLYDPNGYLYSSPSPALALRDGGQDKAETDWNYQQINLTLEPVKGWKIFANLNYKIGDKFRHWDVLPTYNHDVNGNSYLAVQNWYLDTNTQVYEAGERTNYFTPNVYTEYSKTLGKHNLKGMVGYQSELNKFRMLSASRVGVMIPTSPSLDITSGTDASGTIVAPTIGGRYEEWATMGYFGRLNYDFDGRYLIEANLRYDGTSRFREDKRKQLFPSASLGWNVAREEFWKPLENTVNLLKFRASYGELGNQNTRSLYPTYVTLPFGSANGGWLINGVKTNTSSAPGLISSAMTWERVKTWNVGFDLGFLENRLTSTFDMYIRYTNDMIGPAPELPVILGTAVPKTNNTDLETKGMELSISWQDRLKNGLGYSVRFVLSDSRTQITKYPNPTLTFDKYYSGQDYGEIWGYTTIGIAKSDDEMKAHLESMTNGAQTPIGSNWKAGDIMYKDVNGDGKIDNGSNTVTDHGDLTVIGNRTPRYSFGLDLGADWKGLDFRAFFQGVAKRDVWQGSPYFFGATGAGVWDAIGFEEHKDYFRPAPTEAELADPAFVPNPLGTNLDSYYPRPLLGNGKNTRIQTRYMQDASYIRLKNLQLGYTIPASLSRRILVDKCRIFVSGENLFTLTKLSTMFDPETVDGGDNSNGNVYPLCKVYSVGLSLNF